MKNEAINNILETLFLRAELRDNYKFIYSEEIKETVLSFLTDLLKVANNDYIIAAALKER
jgi:hypothetical protein